jgi:hypothetical protein
MDTLCFRGFTNTNSQLALSSSLVQSSGSRCYRAPIVQEVGNLPSVARLRASNEVRYVVAVAPTRAPSLACADFAAAAQCAAAAATANNHGIVLTLVKFSPGYKHVRDFRMQ